MCLQSPRQKKYDFSLDRRVRRRVQGARPGGARGSGLGRVCAKCGRGFGRFVVSTSPSHPEALTAALRCFVPPCNSEFDAYATVLTRAVSTLYTLGGVQTPGRIISAESRVSVHVGAEGRTPPLAAGRTFVGFFSRIAFEKDAAPHNCGPLCLRSLKKSKGTGRRCCFFRERTVHECLFPLKYEWALRRLKGVSLLSKDTTALKPVATLRPQSTKSDCFSRQGGRY